MTLKSMLTLSFFIASLGTQFAFANTSPEVLDFLKPVEGRINYLQGENCNDITLHCNEGTCGLATADGRIQSNLGGSAHCSIEGNTLRCTLVETQGVLSQNHTTYATSITIENGQIQALDCQVSEGLVFKQIRAKISCEKM